MNRCTQPITIVALQRGTSLPTEDKSPEALPEVRGPLDAKKATRNGSLFVLYSAQSSNFYRRLSEDIGLRSVAPGVLP